VTETKITKGQPRIAKAALFGLCPRCGAKSLFQNPVHFSDRCGSCGLDYTDFNVGDGPAALLTLVIGALIIGMAVMLDIAVRPPFWVHVIIWVPFTILMVVTCLRVAKGALLISEFRNRAGEGQQEKP
jgi:uncharacterized protein (DUF983 family)